jgi:S-adenosylmethionine synthetase
VRSLTDVSREELDALARRIILEIGYDGFDDRFGPETVVVDVRVQPQSAEIGAAVDDKASVAEQGAGDQGLMFGYATRETPALMPAPITYAHAIIRELARLRKLHAVNWLRPDAKSQVTIRYVDGRPANVARVVVSTQHDPSVPQSEIRDFVLGEVIPATIPAKLLSSGWQDLVLVNPSGAFTEGGPATDTGLTGRKIIVDTYGGAARHGGGAFSGKDPSKVDRSGAYAARWVAKNVVAAGLARRCEVQVAYAIGVAEPVSVMVDTFNTGAVDEACIENAVREVFDLTPRGIIAALGLRSPIYKKTAAYGHFGRASEVGKHGGTQLTYFSWEKTDRVEALQRAVR